MSLYLALHLSLAGAVYEEAHRGSPCIYTAFTPLLQVVYGVCLKEWGEVHGNEKPAPRVVKSAAIRAGV
ncbi:hypothetical protein KPSB59_3070005 [Klebsiella quasipneumoniae subsp. quasipneumoniae]|nr:hypothetical protein KPSB59_3070005 [Klebsiella quasipneumoniae subsp. quasipneumoniae]CDQ15955.1 hypothetical protein KQQSB11_370084 [Klebsiella quasipneumoniae subsp. quasipneumoniae]